MPDSSSHLSTERVGIVTSSSSKASAICSSSGRSMSCPRFNSSRPRLVANLFAAVRPIRFWFRLPSSPRSGISMNSLVLQSSARTITSWATSTRRRVR